MRRVVALVAVLVLASATWSVAPATESGLSRDVLGWELGYWYDDPVSVTASDGLNASEREAITARAMARIEFLRGLEFRENVSVRVINRSQYLANRSSGTNRTASLWNNQVWKALFLVGDDANISEVFNSTLGQSVVGYYRPGTGDIVIVSDSPQPKLSRGTLVHELVHALQDQHFGLGGDPPTQDLQLSHSGVIEGEANRIQRLYQARCNGGWSCVTVPTSGGGGSTQSAYDRNVFLVVYLPYAAGPDFVEHVAEQGGTEALNRLYENFPASSEQIIHPEAYPDETPVTVTVPDRSNTDWGRFDHEPVADEVGEGSIFAMLSVQGVGNATAAFEYRHPASEGWGGDALVPYRDGDRFGYVWETVWDTRADAVEFHDAYRSILETNDANATEDGSYVIPPSDPYGGAYRVTHDDRTVRIVHGPTRASLDRIHRP